MNKPGNFFSILLAPFKIALGVTGFLLALLYAQFQPLPKASWSIILRNYRSSNNNARLVVTVTGSAVPAPVSVLGYNGLKDIAEGKPGDALAPSGSLLIVVDEGENTQQAEVALDSLLQKPLQGYIEIIVDGDAVNVRAHAYTSGRTIGFNTGSTRRNTDMIAEVTQALAPCPASGADQKAAETARFARYAGCRA